MVILQKRKNGAGHACAVKIYTIPDCCHRVSVLRARHVIEIMVIMVLAPFLKTGIIIMLMKLIVKTAKYSGRVGSVNHCSKQGIKGP